VSVNERIEAHAGAVIGTAGTAPPKTLTLYGEISSAWPTLHDQVDDAVRGLDDPSQVDLVLVDGCINDVNARRFMNAANTPEGIEALAREKCSAPVEGLLNRIASSFPNAHIIVSGYYPVVSDKTPHDLFMRALARIFYAPTEPGQRRMRKSHTAPQPEALCNRCAIMPTDLPTKHSISSNPGLRPAEQACCALEQNDAGSLFRISSGR